MPEFAVAPMVRRTDRIFRRIYRPLSRHAVFYSEMQVAASLVRRPPEQTLEREEDDPVILQIAGTDPGALSASTALGEAYGYAGMNLNFGCPSKSARKGGYGAILMNDAPAAAQAMEAVARTTALPATAKIRLGTGASDFPIVDFVQRLIDSGASGILVHARHAILAKGFTTRNNHAIPPLDYDAVGRLVERFPKTAFCLNGGLASPADALPHARRIGSVMLGRAMYSDPLQLWDVDEMYAGEASPSREACKAEITKRVHAEMERGVPGTLLGRHLAGTALGHPHASRLRLTMIEGSETQRLEALDAALTWQCDNRPSPATPVATA